MKGLNPAQIGKAGELRFASLVILGSRGQIELVPPLADDERRDFELHLKHRFGRRLVIQVKCRTRLITRFREINLCLLYGSRRPVDPTYWFFAAYLDLATLDFADPLFLIPSTALRRGNRVIRYVRPSLAKNARDRFRKYRVSRRQLGGRLVQILEQLNAGTEEAVA